MISKNQFFAIFLIFFFILFIQYLNFTHKTTLFTHQNYKILSHNTSEIDNKNTDIKNLRVTPQNIILETHSNININNIHSETQQPSRDLKPLSKISGKRAVLFTMDSIGSCECDILSVIIFFIDESDSKKGGASGMKSFHFVSQIFR